MTTLDWMEVETPLGTLVAVAGPAGIRWLGFEDEDPPHAAIEGLAATPRRARFDPLRRQLDAYFAGRHRRFDVPVDLGPTSGFLRRALEATRRIPYGSTATYGDVASMAGSPRAARAAGNAMNRNPVAILIPCHRVVPAAGGLGGYGGHEDRKAFLLHLEGAR